MLGLLCCMNEPAGPHGFYDGPVKELAARHLGLIKAILFLLLVSLPGTFFSWVSADNFWVTYKRHYPAEIFLSRPARVEVETRRFSDYNQMPTDEFFEAKVFGSPVSLVVCQAIFRGFVILACGFAMMGVGLLLYRFHRLAKLLYPHLAFYFSTMALVPFLNLLAIFFLLRSALQQMRQMGLRVGMFGIDPARFG